MTFCQNENLDYVPTQAYATEGPSNGPGTQHTP